MATRRSIREKYGVVMLESSDIADRELSAEEASEYENNVIQMLQFIKTYKGEDDQDDV